MHCLKGNVDNISKYTMYIYTLPLYDYLRCVRYQIADGSLPSPFHSTPSPLQLQSPPPIHLCPIYIPSPTLLHLSLFPPGFTLLSLPPCFTDFHSQVTWSSRPPNIVTYPVPSSPCFMLVPLFLVVRYRSLMDLQQSLSHATSSPLYFLCLQVCSISVTSLTPLHSSLFPLFHPSFLHPCFIDICPHVTMILSSFAYSLLTPFLFFFISC